MFVRICCIFIIVFLCFFHCKDSKKIEENFPKQSIQQENTIATITPFSNIKDANLRKRLINLKKKETSTSYKAKVNIVIKKFFPKNKKNKIVGFISFNKKNKKMKINLEDSFFGFKVAQLETDGTKMRIKVPKQKTIFTKLGDIYLDEMNFHLPLQSIYFLLSNQNTTFFNQYANSLVSKKAYIALNSGNNKFFYHYNKDGILSKITIESKNHNLKSLIHIKKTKNSTILKIKTYNRTKILITSLDIKIDKI